jgi:hypothetical protein
MLRTLRFVLVLLRQSSEYSEDYGSQYPMADYIGINVAEEVLPTSSD